MNIPDAERPSLSGYVQPGKLLAWQWAEDRLRDAPAYWITTCTPAFPSSRPIWGIWREGHLWFSSGSSIARSIGRDPRVQINLESAQEVVIVEGVVSGLSVDHVASWVAAYRDKYHWEMPETVVDVYDVRPTRVLGWICDNTGLDGGMLFSNTATQWRFDPISGNSFRHDR